MEQTYCQSCGMPMSPEFYSTNADQSVNTEYCSYCYKDGIFAQDVTMDEMIDHSLVYLEEFNKDSENKFTKEEARAGMKQFFPTLKRWKK
ncbi:zinc ribbon domain-containing protein [Dysgonomonas sp. 520]|uniref:zinc ribbon domain-containing protein n=1 Tax=Dysgonomonas sp. 520 TaxID=2302931 RepID=UPI0013D1D28C|nr:zinc ribbon domain-containing protein [Dysgonomonas sp. 520]NDW08847.1 transcriptional regulator [Dysgonomonas sp. 520]